MLIDSHCHLSDDVLFKDVEGVLARAHAADVTRCITIGAHAADWTRVRALTEHHPSVYATVGIHPNEAMPKEEDVTFEDLCAFAQSSSKIVGIGETGLDFYYDHSVPAVQEERFRVHLRAARACNLPVVVHTRDAEDATVRILTEEAACDGAFPLRGVLHCFTGTLSLAERALALGFYVSFSGIVTFKKTADLRAVACQVPADRILVETDAPWLSPEPWRGKPCEPAYVVKTAELLATIRGVSLSTFAHQTVKNTCELFGLN